MKGTLKFDFKYDKHENYDMKLNMKGTFTMEILDEMLYTIVNFKKEISKNYHAQKETISEIEKEVK